MKKKSFFFLSFGLVIALLFYSCGARSVREQHKFSIAYDFEAGVLPEWSTQRVYDMGNTRVLGLFNDENKKFAPSTSLRLRDLPADTPINFSFDLYLIGTWDSAGKLADRWTLNVKKGGILLDLKTFPNRFRDPMEKIPQGNDGFVKVYHKPRAYWVQKFNIVIPADQVRDGSLTLNFKGNLTGRKTEFWALDNVSVFTD